MAQHCTVKVVSIQSTSPRNILDRVHKPRKRSYVHANVDVGAGRGGYKEHGWVVPSLGAWAAALGQCAATSN